MILMLLLEIKKSHSWQSLWYSENGLLIVFTEYGRPTLGQCVPPLPQLSEVCFYSVEAALPCAIAGGTGSRSES